MKENENMENVRKKDFCDFPSYYYYSLALLCSLCYAVSCPHFLQIEIYVYSLSNFRKISNVYMSKFYVGERGEKGEKKGRHGDDPTRDLQAPPA